MSFMRTFTIVLGAIVSCAVCGTHSREVVGGENRLPDDRAASELLPSTVIAFLEIPALGDIAQTVMDHPIRQRLMDLPAYQKALQSEDFKQVQSRINAFESAMQAPWPAALRTLTAGGITIAVDAHHRGGVALLIKSSDAESLQRFRDFLLTLQLLGGKSTQQAMYRDITAYSLAENQKMVLLDNWLLLTNKPALGKAIVDLYLDRTPQSLSTKPSFIEASRQRTALSKNSAAAWACLDLEAIRQAGIAKDIFQERVGNFFGELALGGILANLQHTPFAMLVFDFGPSHLQLQFRSPHDRQWESPREYFFGAALPASAPPLLEVKNRLLAVSTYRELSQLWLRAGDLMNDRVLDQLAQADTQLSTFFSGRDFGEDILGSIAAGIQFVSQVQEFSDKHPVPAIKLPAFALQFRMKNPESSQADFRRVFQSLIGFVNITGAQNGLPQFDLGMEMVGAAQLYSATYVADHNVADTNQTPIFFNFSPTIGFSGDTLILSSTTSLARELSRLVATGNEGQKSENRHTLAAFDVRQAKKALEINRQQLVANSMLDKGQRQAAAEGEIGLLLEIIGMFQDANFSINVDEQQMQMHLSVTVRD